MSDEGQNKDGIRHVQRALDRLQNSIKPIAKRLEKWSTPFKNIDWDLLKCHQESFFNRSMYKEKGSSLYAWKTYLTYRKYDKAPPKWVLQVFDEIGGNLFEICELTYSKRSTDLLRPAIGLNSMKDFSSYSKDARNLEAVLEVSRLRDSRKYDDEILSENAFILNICEELASKYGFESGTSLEKIYYKLQPIINSPV